MGDNTRGAIFEQQVLDLAASGLLSPKLLDTLAEPHRDTDIDEGGFGYHTLPAPDNRDVREIVLDTLGIRLAVAKPGPDEDANAYRDAVDDAWMAICSGRWGWR
jgi:hypothetical protein